MAAILFRWTHNLTFYPQAHFSAGAEAEIEPEWNSLYVTTKRLLRIVCSGNGVEISAR